MQWTKMFRLFFCGAVLSLGLAFIHPLQRELAPLQGQLTDMEGKPLQGAIVILSLDKSSFGRSKISDVDGMFEFQDIPPGTYTLNVSLPEFIPARLENIVLEAGQTKEVKLDMAKFSPKKRYPRYEQIRGSTLSY